MTLGRSRKRLRLALRKGTRARHVGESGERVPFTRWDPLIQRGGHTSEAHRKSKEWPGRHREVRDGPRVISDADSSGRRMVRLGGGSVGGGDRDDTGDGDETMITNALGGVLRDHQPSRKPNYGNPIVS